jgi:hypothetical protein
MRELKTSIEINSTPAKVWQVLMDFENYPDWNPFVKSIQGVASVGKKLKVCIHPPGQKDMMFRPILLKVEKNKEFRWIGHLLFPGILDGEHIFMIESLDNSKVLFRQEEHFSGILVPVFWKSLFQHTRIGFIEMNHALKERVEKPVG